jgi:Transcriptional regulators
MIKPIERQNVVDAIYSKMLDMIITGEWQQDAMIPSENELSEAFAVSRDTVRQAINRFSALGILRSYQGKGTYVQKIDTSFYLNLIVPAVFLGEDAGISVLEFMKAIQVESVRLICQHASDKEIEELGNSLELMHSAGASDYETYFKCDMDYHRYLVQFSGNPLFEKVMDIVEKLLQVCLKDIVTYYGNAKSLYQHDECFQAIQSRRGEDAVNIMVEHYDMLIERMREWMAMDESEREKAQSRFK